MIKIKKKQYNFTKNVGNLNNLKVSYSLYVKIKNFFE